MFTLTFHLTTVTAAPRLRVIAQLQQLKEVLAVPWCWSSWSDFFGES